MTTCQTMGRQLAAALICGSVAVNLQAADNTAEVAAVDEKEKSLNSSLRPRALIDLKDVPAYKGSCAKRFHRGEHGEVVLDCGGDDIATSDGGKTWHTYAGARLWPSNYFGPFQVKDELVAVNEGNYTGALIKRSSDGGKTWSSEEKVPPAPPTKDYPKLRGPYFFSVTATSTGRIIIPGDYLTGNEGPDPDVLIIHSSGDGGRTWRQSAPLQPPDPMPKAPEGFGEPAVAELADGTLLMVFRTCLGHLWRCTSKDGGLTWSAPSSTGLASPLANPKVARIPGSDAIILVWNFAKAGISRSWGSGPSANNVWGPRKPLVLAISRDAGKTWTCPTVICETQAIYATIHFTETQIYIVYEFLPTGAETHHIGVAVYDVNEALKQPAWTHETIKPYIDAGLIAPWMDLNIP